MRPDAFNCLWLFTSVYGGYFISIPSRTHLRSASVGMFNVPRTRIRRGSQAFTIAGPRACNTLPTSIKLLSCRATFKRHLKTFLFVQSCDP